LLGVPFLSPGGPIRPVLAMMLVLGAVLVGSNPARQGLRGKVQAPLGSVFASIFVGLPLAFLTGLRTMDDEEMGRDLLVLLLVVIWVGDTAAMYVGMLAGRHRLAPRISPRKSIEGAVAGVAGAIGA